MATRRTWVLGGGGARGAAQVGVLLGLFESGVDPPVRLFGASVGALNAATVAAYPSLAGAEMLREIWLGPLARAVFRSHPVGLLLSQLRRRLSTLPASNVSRLIERQVQLIGVESFEDLQLPLGVVATDLAAGTSRIFSSGPLAPALQASTAIPGVFPPVRIDGREYSDGGIVDNLPIGPALAHGSRDVVGISLMAGGELERPPTTWAELIARTLQLSLHQRMLADYERLRGRGRVVIICPVLSTTASWDMRRDRVEAVVQAASAGVKELLSRRGSRLFRHSGIHYVDAQAAAG